MQKLTRLSAMFAMANAACTGFAYTQSVKMEMYDYDASDSAATKTIDYTDITIDADCYDDTQCKLVDLQGTDLVSSYITLSQTQLAADKPGKMTITAKIGTKMEYDTEFKVKCDYVQKDYTGPVGLKFTKTSEQIKISTSGLCTFKLSQYPIPTAPEDLTIQNKDGQRSSEVTHYGLKTDDASLCPFTSCKLFLDGNEYTGSEATITGTKIKFTPLASETFGWNKQFTSECKTDFGPGRKSKPYMVKYTNACDNAVVVDNTQIVKEMGYSATEWTNSMPLPITNALPTKCAVSCALKNGSATNIKLNQADDKSWGYQITQNIAAGQSVQTNDFVCTSDNASNKVLDEIPIKYSQTSTPCLVALAKIKTPETSVDYTFKALTKETGSLKWSTQYTNTQEPNTDCPVSYKLFAADCTAAVSTAYGTFSIADKQDQLSAPRGFKAGYSQDVCIQVDNGFQKLNFLYKVNQSGRCIATLSQKSASSILKSKVLTYEDTLDQKNVANANTDFFVNSDEAECAINQCKLLKSDCKSPHGNSALKIDDSTFQITATINKPYGYNDEYCVQCSNGDVSKPSQTVNYSSFRINLPNICVTALTAKTPYKSSNVVAFDKTKGSSEVLTDDTVAEFFNNKDSTNCPVHTCGLYKYDATNGQCNGANRLPAGQFGFNKGTQTGVKSTKVQQDSDNNGKYKLMTVKDVPNGFDQKFCVKCESDHASAINGPIQVEQTGMCYDQLELKQGVKAYDAIPFTSENNNELKSFGAEGFKDYFNNTDETECPITGCQVKQLTVVDSKNTCGNGLLKDNKNVVVNQTTPFDIQALSNQVKGYSQNVCYECSNKHRTMSAAITGLTQETKCKQTLQIEKQISETGEKTNFDTQTPSIKLAFNDQSSKDVIGGALKVMKFENSDNESCGVKACMLKKEGCLVDYDGQYITMDDHAPFNVHAKVGIPEGFVEKFCIQCQNYEGNKVQDGMMVQRDQITVTQTGEGALWWIWIIVAIIVLGGGGAAFIKYRNDQQAEEEAKEQKWKADMDNQVANQIEHVRRESIQEARKSMQMELDQMQEMQEITGYDTGRGLVDGEEPQVRVVVDEENQPDKASDEVVGVVHGEEMD